MQSFPEPAWLADVPEQHRANELTRFYLQLAALYSTPAMSVAAMSDAMGMSRQYVHGAYNSAWSGHSVFPQSLADKIAEQARCPALTATNLVPPESPLLQYRRERAALRRVQK